MTITDAFDADRPMPWLFEVAAEFADEPVAGLDEDPGVIARSLTGAADLFSLPAVVVSFDTSVAAEAVGCTVTDAGVEGIVESVDDAFAVNIDAATNSDRLQVRLDATERLSETCDAPVLGGVTGPALLAEQLLADQSVSAETREEAVFTAGEICVELANAYLDADADGVAILEPEGLDAPLYREAIEPVVNTLDHYEAEGVIIGETLTQQDVRTAGEVGFDGVTGAVEDRENALQAATDSDILLGVGIPRETFRAGPDAVATYREETPSDVGLSSQWTVPRDIAPEAIHELMDSL